MDDLHQLTVTELLDISREAAFMASRSTGKKRREHFLRLAAAVAAARDHIVLGLPEGIAR